MKLALRDRFRLFLHGAVRELALIATLKQEHRTYRDAFNNLVATLTDHDVPRAGHLYVMIDSETLLVMVRRVYGADHPYTRKLVEFRRTFGFTETQPQVVN